MKEEEDRGDYHLDPDSPEVMDEIIALERTDYIKRSQMRVGALIALTAMMIVLVFQTPKAMAGGPKCDRIYKHQGGRYCRECNRIYTRRRRQKEGN